MESMQTKGPTVRILSLSPAGSLHKFSKSSRFLQCKSRLFYNLRIKAFTHLSHEFVFTIPKSDMFLHKIRLSSHINK